MTLYWNHVGPLMRYESGLLRIEDLNPDVKTQWRMSRMEMLGLGWRCIVAGLAGARTGHDAVRPS